MFNSKGNIEVVKYLLDSGADMNIKNNSGKSPKEIGEIMLKDKFKELIKDN
ncbi:MAG: ankyrin repeat domain-containing protein [Allomuricauda sp.]